MTREKQELEDQHEKRIESLKGKKGWHVDIIVIELDASKILAEHEEAIKHAKQLIQDEYDQQIKTLQGNKEQHH